MTDAAESFDGELTDESACPYLPDRNWRSFVIAPEEPLTPERHRELLDQGFRRAGVLLFRPACPTCDACRPMRIDVRRFQPSRSQRRALRRNGDLAIVKGPPDLDEEKRSLLERYLDARHVGPMTADEEITRRTLFDPTDHSWEIDYRDPAGRLVGVGLLDLADGIGSSNYFFFDPVEKRRSLGVFSMLVEIAFTRARGGHWFHPGYWIDGCRAMRYKERFGPSEVLLDGAWRSFPD